MPSMSGVTSIWQLRREPVSRSGRMPSMDSSMMSVSPATLPDASPVVAITTPSDGVAVELASGSPTSVLAAVTLGISQCLASDVRVDVGGVCEEPAWGDR